MQVCRVERQEKIRPISNYDARHKDFTSKVFLFLTVKQNKPIKQVLLLTVEAVSEVELDEEESRDFSWIKESSSSKSSS